MKEFLGNAWVGWHDFTDAGKLAALLMISLLFLWIYYKKVDQRTFLIYTTAAAACCAVPATAACLMVYQSRFYDYEWIWSFVPMTAMIGFAAIVFLTDYLMEAVRGDKKKAAAAVAGLLAVALLCGRMGMQAWDNGRETAERASVEAALPRLEEKMADREIFLWAPREVLEYVREYDAGVRLLYGRNMWEDSLNAYVYGGYTQEMQRLYEWMDGKNREETVPVQACVEILEGTDVNCILLPGDTEEETIRCFEEALGMSRESLGKYCLLVR